MSSYLKSHCANQKILRSIYFTIFDSCLNYADLIRAQNYNATQQVIILQKNQNNIITVSKLSFKASFQKNNILIFMTFH